MSGDNHMEVVDLLARTALKERAAFERLYRLTSMKLFPLLLRILKREDLAQECLQEAYVQIWNRAEEYRNDLAAPITWMTTIARYRALDLLRRRKHEVPLEDEMLLDGDEERDGLLQQLEATEDGVALAECMKQLSQQQRNCIYLAYFEGSTHPEIASRMDVPVGSVKTWIRRGMSSLKGCLS